jgi:methyl-accepting chemotaxis protein
LDGTSDEKLNADVICLDNQCTLGQWIYGDGQKFKDMEGFEALRDTHANFHKCAAEVIRKTDTGEKPEAETIFKNDYSVLSKDITRMLVKMNAVMKNLRK